MVLSRDFKKIVKKKYVTSSKDKKDWMNFTKQIGDISPKEAVQFGLIDKIIENRK